MDLRDVADTWRTHVEEKGKTQNCRLSMHPRLCRVVGPQSQWLPEVNTVW